MAEHAPVMKSPKKKGNLLRKLFRMDLMEKRNLAGYVFVLPIFIGFILIFLPALFQSIQFSLSEIQIRTDGTGYDLISKGFSNYYKAFFVDANFVMVLGSSLRDMVINLPVILIFSFFMSLLLNRKKFPGRTVLRVIFFLPVVIYSGVASTAGLTSGSGETAEIAAQIFSDPTIASGGSESMQSGLQSIMGMALSIRIILESMQLPTWMMNFIFMSISRLEWIIQSSGVQILVFLAALQSIPTSVFEAAQVEGLTGWEMFWKITLPMISSMILVNSIYTIVDSFTNPKYEIHEFIRNQSFAKADYGYGSALSVIYFIAVIVLIGIVSAIVSRYVFYND